MFGISALQPLYLCLGGLLCSPVLALTVVLTLYSARRHAHR
jgi:hypothetical protein